jgi:hypothetical protein
MSNVETFKHPSNATDGALIRTRMICEGVGDLHDNLEQILHLLRGSNVVVLEPAPHEKVGDGLPAVIDTTARYLARCQQLAADIRKIL